MAAKGLVPGDEDIARGVRAAGTPGDPRDQQDRRSPRPRRSARVLSARASTRCSRSAPSTGRASAICSTRSSSSCRTAPARAGSATDERSGRRPADETAHRHRRPAERRQVVAGQSLAARGADDRQRDARHDARFGGLAAARGIASKFRIVDTAGIRRPGRVARSRRRSRSLSVHARAARDRARRRRGAGDRRDAGSRPIRTARSRARPTKPGAA